MTFFVEVARLLTKYCYEDWVVEKSARDLSGNMKKRKYLLNCTESTEGFIIAWIGILIMIGAHSGAGQRTTRKYWRSPLYGLCLPYVMNTMSHNAFEFLRRYIHFADNSKAKLKGTAKYDPLFKVKYVLDVMMNGMRLTWTAGQYITIDESMIKYMGRAISFVQYMPAKPIKHGIKVYAACCAFSGVLLAFRVFTGNEDSSDFHRSTVSICDTLIRQADLNTCKGRVLITDNYYTTVALAKHMFTKYRWTIIGTITPTDKKSRTDEDFPFLKLSNGALKDVERGWYREAALVLKDRLKKFYLQATTWRDKKQVCFLSNNVVGPSDGMTVCRAKKGANEKEVIAAPQAQQDYVRYFNAVDRNDRDSADYSTSVRTSRYYLRIFNWVLDRVVHTVYVVVCYLAKSDIGPPSWKKYLNKSSG